MLIGALRAVGRSVATVGRVTMPSRRTLARTFGALERRLQPKLAPAGWSDGQKVTVDADLQTDGGHSWDDPPADEERTTTQEPWLVAADPGAERWDEDDLEQHRDFRGIRATQSPWGRFVLFDEGNDAAWISADPEVLVEPQQLRTDPWGGRR